MMFKELSGNALKVIAIVAMTIDHLAWVGIETYEQAETPAPYMPFVRNSEQIVQYNVLIHILSLFVLRNAVCRHHHQLYGMGLCMLFAMEKRFNLVF